VKAYVCGKTFHLAPLKALLHDTYAYGLFLIEAEVATFGILGPEGITLLEESYSIVPKKQRKGGQSSVRYDRVREGLLHDFFKRTAEKAKGLLYSQKGYRGTLVGGPGPTKDEFLKDFPQSRVIGVVDVGDSGQSGLRELVGRSADLLKDETSTKERTLLQEFFGRLGKGDSKVVYGKNETKAAYAEKRLERLFVSESEGAIDEQGAVRISAGTEEGRMFAGLGGWGGYLKY